MINTSHFMASPRTQNTTSYRHILAGVSISAASLFTCINANAIAHTAAALAHATGHLHVGEGFASDSSPLYVLDTHGNPLHHDITHVPDWYMYCRGPHFDVAISIANNKVYNNYNLLFRPDRMTKILPSEVDAGVVGNYFYVFIEDESKNRTGSLRIFRPNGDAVTKLDRVEISSINNNYNMNSDNIAYLHEGTPSLLSIQTGEITKFPQYKHIKHAGDGVFWAQSPQNNRYSLIDNEGTVIIDPTYTSVSLFKNNSALVQIGGYTSQYIMIDNSGKSLAAIPDNLICEIPVQVSCDLIAVKDKASGLAGYFSARTLSIAIPCVFDSAGPFSEGYANVVLPGQGNDFDIASELLDPAGRFKRPLPHSDVLINTSGRMQGQLPRNITIYSPVYHGNIMAPMLEDDGLNLALIKVDTGQVLWSESRNGRN